MIIHSEYVILENKKIYEIFDEFETNFEDDPEQRLEELLLKMKNLYKDETKYFTKKINWHAMI